MAPRIDRDDVITKLDYLHRCGGLKSKSAVSVDEEDSVAVASRRVVCDGTRHGLPHRRTRDATQLKGCRDIHAHQQHGLGGEDHQVAFVRSRTGHSQRGPFEEMQVGPGGTQAHIYKMLGM